MKETGTLILTRGQTFWHYVIISFLFIVPVMAIIDVFKFYVTHTYNSTKPIGFNFGYVWILPALIFYFIQRHRLKSTIINISVDNNAFHDAVKQTANELEWDVTQMANEIVVAKSGFSWRSRGEQITILPDNNNILFNSICDPDNRPSVASLGMNKLNR